MSSTQVRDNAAPDAGEPGTIDMKLEAVVIPVSDVDRAKAFYGSLGWRLDADFPFDNGFRVVQFTPPGSGSSVQFGTNITSAAPGSAQGLYLIVSDIEAARDELVARGVEVSEVFHAGTPGAQFQPDGTGGRVNGLAADRASYGSFATFSDPDRNGWLLQEVTTRLPGRVLGETAYSSAEDLAQALRRAAAAHGEHEKRLGGEYDVNWPDWYAEYMVAERAGTRAAAVSSAAMRAITYTTLGDPSVLKLVERPIPEPGEGEVRIRVRVSGVNPTDWKSRSGTYGGGAAEPTVPNHDGAGVIDELGAGVAGFGVGDRVWVTLAGDGRPAGGTAQDYTVVPVGRVFPLPDVADFELGASVGIPAVTAHRALTVAEDGPARLHPDALSGRVVLVAGGAGAVGNAAIQLARWAGATVIATVSGEAKATLASAAGAHHVVSYKDRDVAEQIRRVARAGVDQIVEVAAGANAELDQTVLRPRGTISIYANDGGAPFNLDVRRNMGLNARYQFVLLYTVGWELITAAAADLNQAIEDGAYRVGEDVGLPLHRFSLEDASGAHAAVERGAVGKVLITVASGDPPSPEPVL